MRAAPLLVVAAGLALAVSGCGGSSHKAAASAGKYGPASSPAAESRCMRANGVPNFPDPIQGSGGEGLPTMESSPGTLTVEGIAFSGPAFTKAEKACKEYLPPAGGPPPALAAAQLRRAVTVARCMRRHGVPNFPDPASTPSAAPPKTLSDLNTSSPAFQKAAQVCTGSHGGHFLF
jgi:hypothetical protein